MQSDSIAKLVSALVKVQSQIRGYKEDSTNPFFSSKYGDLSSVWSAIREPLTGNGLCVIQAMEGHDDGRQILRTVLAHESGEWIDGHIAIKPSKDDPQQTGSAITYARRYALAAIVGIAPEDDDAESATDHRSTKDWAAQKSTPEKKAKGWDKIRKETQAKADAAARALQQGQEQMNAAQQPSDAINGNACLPGYDRKDSNSTVWIPFDEKKKTLAKSVVYLIDGQEVLFPITHIKRVKYYDDRQRWEVEVTEWIAQKKIEDGKLDPAWLPVPDPAEEGIPTDDDVSF